MISPMGGARTLSCSSVIGSWGGSWARLQRAGQGHGGALVVEGPAGIGKTVLLAASRDVAEGEGFRVLRARGSALSSSESSRFGVVRQLIESVVAGASEDERAWLLDGPPGVAAELLGLRGLGKGATKATVAPGPVVRGVARALLVVRQPGDRTPSGPGGR